MSTITSRFSPLKPPVSPVYMESVDQVVAESPTSYDVPVVDLEISPLTDHFVPLHPRESQVSHVSSVQLSPNRVRLDFDYDTLYVFPVFPVSPRTKGYLPIVRMILLVCTLRSLYRCTILSFWSVWIPRLSGQPGCPICCAAIAEGRRADVVELDGVASVCNSIASHVDGRSCTPCSAGSTSHQERWTTLRRCPVWFRHRHRWCLWVFGGLHVPREVPGWIPFITMRTARVVPGVIRGRPVSS